MKFKEFINELAMPLPTVQLDHNVVDLMNRQLEDELDDIILSPEIGFFKISKVLRRFGLDLPVPYDIETEGDESVYDLNDGGLLYVLYVQTDDGNYEFFAKETDLIGMEELLSKDEGL